MSKTVIRGSYYMFDRSALHREVGATISETKARVILNNGGDVYTLFKEDAYKLAISAWGGRATLDGGHGPGYFSHYHPGGVHPLYIPGHPKAKSTPATCFLAIETKIGTPRQKAPRRSGRKSQTEVD